MGKYTKQKSGLYRTGVLLGYGPDGKPKKKYLSAPTIKELEQKIFDVKNEMSNGLIVSDNTLFGTYSQNWLKIYKGNRSLRTQGVYKSNLKYAEGLNDIPVKKINRLMIQQIINDNSEHPRTCEMILLTLKQVFKSAQEDGLILKNPCTGIDLPRHVPQEKRALTAEEKEKLRSAVLQPKERLLLLLLYGTGCRPSEAYALTKSDFDFKGGTVSISKSAKFNGNQFVCVDVPKTNSSIRSVIVSESICRALKHIIDKIPTENILGGNTGEIMSRQHYRAIFEKILAKAGLKDSGITQYTFRHNFCTECYYNGISLKECQRLMGHKDYKMIMEVYSHLDASRENTKTKMSSMVM